VTARNSPIVAARDGFLVAVRDGSHVAARDGPLVAARDGSLVAARDGSLVAARGGSPMAARDCSPMAARGGPPVAARDGSLLDARDGFPMNGLAWFILRERTVTFFSIHPTFPGLNLCIICTTLWQITIKCCLLKIMSWKCSHCINWQQVDVYNGFYMELFTLSDLSPSTAS
jgi:hypothetical protein